MTFKSFATWIFNLHIVPSGYLTKGVGWGAVLTSLPSLVVAAACAVGHPLQGIPCPQNPGQAVLTALTGMGFIGLGRRQ